MNCCRSGPCEQMFKSRVAKRSLARYRKRGLDRLGRRMVGSIVASGVEGATVLEIGGGIGAVQSDRTSFVVTDVLEHPESVHEADFVVLNRLVCCSPDGVELTAAAARLTPRKLALRG